MQDDDEMQEAFPEDGGLQQELDYPCELLGQEHHQRVLQRNTAVYDSDRNLEVRLGNLGLTCRGTSSGSSHMILDRCPKEAILDLDTAHLQRRESRGFSILRLANRCVGCYIHFQLRRFLEHRGIEAGPQSSVCASQNCNRLPVHRCAYCPLHLSTLLQNSHKSILSHSITQLQEMFQNAIRKEWRIQPQYDVVRKRTGEILQNKRPGTDLIILDDEFSPASQQLWEFAMIELVSGKVLVNTKIDHHRALDRNASTSSSASSLPFWSQISRVKAKGVYSSARNTSLEHMNVDEVAFRLRQVGISPSIVIIVYHVTNFDRTLLTRFLESAGYFGYLPTEENCIPIVNVLRPHLSDRMSSGRRFPLNLEVLFPLMFPRHSLVGMNHQALADCQQTRLCKPVAERGEEWRPDAVARSSQRSILDWLQDSP
ncbi:hypothetical protein P171DRAFT_447581 [Karstenula rhodostoma CBS 690.94]|uniref:Uncharacterized protein n=1 Tax=Karstenula rhodostoma CBS 690.94 TaxID=1392251 RepID=A0A9P4PB37_9PLEO|nr:hypothetical protein P171DRAFT_447581 [Karstenula rhodostoma CBS 690.94]